MPTFRERPLTWLFWIATICATITGYVKNPEANWLNVILLAQLYVVSGWAALSTAHRLMRGASLVLAPLILALFTHATQRSPDESAYVLAFALILGGAVFIATRVFAYIVLTIGPPLHRDGRLWQISIVELFGWTIVAALGSWALSMAKLRELDEVMIPWETLAGIVPPSILMSVFLAPRPRHDRASLLLAATGFALFYAAANRLGSLRIIDHVMFAAVFGYVGLWVLVVRLDEQAVVTLGASEHQLGSSIGDTTEE
jgi:hypothetical protein